MAAQREYKMLFTLASALAGNFSGAFQKAQQELLKLNQAQKELANNKADVSAMKKLTDEIKNTEDKARRMAEKLANLRDEINNTQNPSANLKNKFIDLAGEAAKTAQKLQEKKDKLEELRKALEAAGYDTKDLAALEAKLTDEMKKNAGEIDVLNGKLANGAVGMEEFTDVLVSGGIIEGLRSLAEAYGDCVKSAADFEQSMSNVEALSGANSLEMAQLEKKALDLAASTKYTALEVGDAMGYMGMAGWDASEMLGGMSGVINLAAASGEDLAVVSDIVTDNLTAFRMSASETSKMADILAAAATNSNTNVEIMGETFKNSAAVAGALGYSLTDVATAIGIMANNGVKGSIAGTALRNIFNGLIKGVTLTSDAFGEYEFSTVKADGTLMSFADTIDVLRDKFSLMTEAEKVLNAKELAGMRGYNGLLSLINATDDDYASLASSIENSAGAAQKMANIKLDNLNGQLTIMKSAWDAIKISLGSEFNDELTSLVKSFTEILHAVNDFIKLHPHLTKGLIAAAGALTSIVLALNAAKVAMAAFNVAAKVLGVSMLGITGPILGVSAAIGALAAMNSIYQESESYARKQLSATSRARYDEIEALKDERDELERNGQDTIEISGRIEELSKAYNDSSQTAAEFAQSQKDVAKAYAEMSEAQRQADDRLNTRETLVGRLTERLYGLVDSNGKLVGSEGELQSVIALLNKEMPSLNIAYDKQTGSINKTTAAVKGLVKAKLDAARYEADIDALAEQQRQEQALIDAEAAAAEELAYRTKEYEEKRAKMDPDGDGFGYEAEQVAMSKAAEAHALAVKNLEEHKQKVEELTAAVESYLAEQSIDTASPEGIVKTYVASLQLLADSYQEVYDAALKSISGQNTMWDEAAEVAPDKIEELNKNLQGQIEYWKAYNENLAFLEDFGNSSGIEGITDLIGKFKDSAGSEKAVNFVAGLTEAAKKGDGKEIETLIQSMKDLTEQQETTADEFGRFVTDFDQATEDLLQQAEAAVEGLTMDEEAAQAAKDTLEAYIDEMSNTEYATRAENAIKLFKERIGNSLKATPPTVSVDGTAGYASGTSSAPAGWAMVGEQGPELMYMRGGERVLNHGDTVRTMTSSAAASNNSISVAFNIEGNADSGTVQNLQNYAEDFASRVMDIITEANSNAARRAYA